MAQTDVLVMFTEKSYYDTIVTAETWELVKPLFENGTISNSSEFIDYIETNNLKYRTTADTYDGTQMNVSENDGNPTIRAEYFYGGGALFENTIGECTNVTTLNHYQREAIKTAFYTGDKLVYPALGLAGETGEVVDKIKKLLRDSNGIATDEFLKELAKELGDVLWYLSVLASNVGYTLSEVASMNLQKIHDRKERGKLHGSGDNR